jgi:hypothetical protein
MKANGIFDKFRKPGPTAPVQSDVLTQIERLASLRQSGALTDAEFEGKKAELLKRL